MFIVLIINDMYSSGVIFFVRCFFVALLLSIYFCPDIHLKLTKYMFV